MKKDRLEEEPLDITYPSIMIGLDSSFVIVPTNYEGNDVGFFGFRPLPNWSREEWTKFQLGASTFTSSI
jgi:hypothetical protein